MRFDGGHHCEGMIALALAGAICRSIYGMSEMGRAGTKLSIMNEDTLGQSGNLEHHFSLHPDQALYSQGLRLI